MVEKTSSREIKTCCSGFYQSDFVRNLLGDALHPGGLALTSRLGEVLALTPDDRVLDVACGRGASAVHLADRHGCHVTGVDYGIEAIAAAIASAAERGVAQRTCFYEGDAECLPLEDGAFEAVISECSFCTFPNKESAAREMARVLAPGGRLGLTDVTISGPLPTDIRSLLAWVTCVAGAGASEEYVRMLREAGFTEIVLEDHADALREMALDVQRRLLGVELAAGLGALNLGALDPDLAEAKRLARRVGQLVQDGVVGYTLIGAQKA